eukprot:Amastigsp_a175498_54.p7 type:complete len:110 gc:universal Amastigsp_a175498_54:1248-919(-)
MRAADSGTDIVRRNLRVKRFSSSRTTGGASSSFAPATMAAASKASACSSALRVAVTDSIDDVRDSGCSSAVDISTSGAGSPPSAVALALASTLACEKSLPLLNATRLRR